MGQGNIIGKPNLPVTARAKGVWSLREQYLANRSGTWPGYDPQWPNTTLLLKTASTAADTFIDSSPNNFAVTRVGDTIQTTSTPYAPYWSNFFDGSGDYLTVANSSVFNMDTGAFTIEFWMNPTAVPTGFAVTMVSTYNGGSQGWAVQWRTSPQVIRFGFGDTTLIDRDFPATTYLNKWTHIAVSREANGNTRVFFDGVQQGAVTALGSSSLNSTGPLYLGLLSPATGQNYTGFLSSVRVVKGTALYTSNFTPSTTPLTAITNTSLLTCQDNRFIDRSTNNFALTRTGDVAVSRFSPFAWQWSAASGGGGYFDGAGDYLSIPTNPAFDFGTGDFTVEAWVRPEALPADWFIVSASGSGGLFLGYGNGAVGYGRAGVAWDGSGYGGSGVSLPINAWSHVALTRSGTSIRLFVNGVQAGATANSSQSYNISTGSLNIGSQGANYYLNGHVANVRIVKGTALYTSAFTPPTAPVTAIANTSLLLNFTNAAFTDTAIGHTLRQGGTPARGTFTYEPDLTSTRFNGTTDYVTAFGPQLAVLAGNFTVECWVYLNSTTNTFASSRAASGGSVLYWSFSVDAGTLTGQIRNSGGTQFWSRSATGVMVTGRWYHVAFVRNNSVTTVYLDGVAGPTTGNDGGTSVTEQSVAVGFFNFPGYVNYYNGLISNFRFSRSAVYTANFTPTRTVLPVTTTTALSLNQAVDVWDATAKNNLSSTGTIVATPNMFTGSALSLNGSQAARVYSGTPTTTNFGFGTGDFTIEAWIYPTAVTGADRCLWDTRAAAADAGMVVFIDTNGKLSNYTSNAIRLTSTPSLVANTWQHVAVSRTSGTLGYFINGQPAGAVAYATTIDCPGQARIGIRFDNAAGFSGTIDELRVSKVGRYTGAFRPSDSPFTQDWEPFYNDTLSGTNALQLKSIDVGGASNNVFRDDSSNNFTVTRFGDTTQGSLSPYIPYGYWSGYFDGSGDYLTLPANAAYAMGTGDFTIECWVMFTGINGVANGIFQTGTSHFPASVTNSIALGTSTSGSTWQIYAKNTNTNSTATWRLGQWYHCAVVRASGTTRLYINGTSVITVTADTADYTGTFLGIGAIYSTSYSQNGYISDFRVVKGTAVYTADFTPPNRLTAITNTSLLTLQDNRFIDKSVNNFAITRTGDVAISRYAPFPFGVPVQTTAATNPGSAYFDGTGDWLAAPNAAANFTNQNFTAECWVRFTTNSIGYQPIMGNTGTADAQGWIVITETNNLVYAYFSTSGSGWTQSLGGTFTPPINAWTHFALVRNGTTITLYANGASIGSTTIGTGTIHSPTGAFYAGYYPFFPGGARSLTGYMSNIRLVTGTAVYTSAFTTPTSPLTAITNTSLLTAQNANAINADASTNNRTVTIGGDAKGNDLSPFPTSQRVTYAYGGSGYFDGTGDYLLFSSSSALTLDGDFCIEAWVCPTALSVSYPTILGANAGSFGGGNAATFMLLSNGQVRIDNAVAAIGTSGTAVPVNAWTHVAATRSGTTVRLFVNGILGGSGTMSSAYNFHTSGTRVGAVGWDAASSNYTGFISNLRVVKGTAVYTGNFTPPTSPVTAISGTSVLLNFDNAGVYDGTGRQNILTAGTSSSSTVQKKHDLASQLVTANVGGFIPVPATSPNYVFGTGDFTIEFWVYRNVVAQQVIYDQRPTSTQGVYPTIYCEGATLNYYVSSGIRIAGPSLAAGQWYHIAVSRAASQTRLFVDGVQQGATYADTNSYICGTNRPMIGNNGFAADYQFNGYIENLRVSRVGRYTANFTVPSESFPVA